MAEFKQQISFFPLETSCWKHSLQTQIEVSLPMIL